ncbi:MAG: hypothetical protein ACTSPB_04560 [Candidatus Thorarchaeota archaeon]
MPFAPFGYLSGREAPAANTTVLNAFPAAVDLLSPGNNSEETSTPTFNWTQSNDSNGQSVTYYLIIDNDDDFSSVELNVSSLGVSEYTLTFSEALSAGNYYWRVDAYDGIDYNLSDVRNFSVTVAAPGPPGAGGGGGGFKNIDYSIDKDEIQVKLKYNEEVVKYFKITNLGNQARFVLRHNLGVLMNVSDTSFVLRKGQVKRIRLVINGSETGVHTGEITINAEGVKKTLPILIEVESIDKYFDIYTITQPSRIYPDGCILINTTIQNLYNVSKEIDIKYGLMDTSNKIVVSETKKLFLKDEEAVVYLRLCVPKDIDYKDYIIYVMVDYLDTVTVSTDILKIIPFEEIEVLTPIIILLLVLMLIIAVGKTMKLSKEKRLTKVIKYDSFISTVEKYRLKRKLLALERAWKAKAITRETYLKSKKKIKERLRKF